MRVEPTFFTRSNQVVSLVHELFVVDAQHSPPSWSKITRLIGDVLESIRRNFTNPVAPSPLATESLI